MNYTSEEVMHLLQLLEDVVPVSKTDWDNVVTSHSERYPGRDVISLRRKFQSLHRRRVPTGDPNMPEEIRLAKEVKELIGRRAHIGTGDEEFDMAGEGTFTTADGDSRPAAPVNVAVRPSSIGEESGDRVDDNTDCATPSSVGNRRGSSVAVSSAAEPSFTPPFESRKGGKKMDMFDLFMFQSREEARARAHERSEAAKDRHASIRTTQ